MQNFGKKLTIIHLLITLVSYKLPIWDVDTIICPDMSSQYVNMSFIANNFSQAKPLGRKK